MVGYMTEMVLTNRPVLCVGGGQVARRKLAGLLPCGPQITVVAPELHPEIGQMVRAGQVRHRAESFAPALLEETPRPVLVFAVTGEAALNREIARQAAQRGLWCNAADDPASSGFLVPAVVRRGPVVVAVSTGGLSPALARLLKERLNVWLEPGWGSLAVLFGAMRERVKQCFADPAARQSFWRETCLAVVRERRFEQGGNDRWLEARLVRASGREGPDKDEAD
ncbi:MAG: bifunctional precorrin-2 dehydrogenase/sirohydrochlorin ferrochelatase [Magnetococcales bacterium]|nr:bifunctional precorrin-2 dehydrogenase/sirohydrochlorin ferrochelatase [Magnetococcales bacterium]